MLDREIFCERPFFPLKWGEGGAMGKGVSRSIVIGSKAKQSIQTYGLLAWLRRLAMTVFPHLESSSRPSFESLRMTGWTAYGPLRMTGRRNAQTAFPLKTAGSERKKRHNPLWTAPFLNSLPCRRCFGVPLFVLIEQNAVALCANEPPHNRPPVTWTASSRRYLP